MVCFFSIIFEKIKRSICFTVYNLYMHLLIYKCIPQFMRNDVKVKTEYFVLFVY